MPFKTELSHRRKLMPIFPSPRRKWTSTRWVWEVDSSTRRGAVHHSEPHTCCHTPGSPGGEVGQSGPCMVVFYNFGALYPYSYFEELYPYLFYLGLSRYMVYVKFIYVNYFIPIPLNESFQKLSANPMSVLLWLYILISICLNQSVLCLFTAQVLWASLHFLSLCSVRNSCEKFGVIGT